MNKNNSLVGNTTGGVPAQKKDKRAPNTNLLYTDERTQIKYGITGSPFIDSLIEKAFIADSCQCCTDFQTNCLSCEKLSNFGLERG